MDIDEEFDSLGLPRAKESLAWEARAKIIWGQPVDEVETWLTASGIDRVIAEQIIAIAIRERAASIRVKGIRDLVLGILIGVAGAAIGIGTVMIVKLGLVAVPVKRAAFLAVIAFLAFMYGAHLTWRGLARIIGGARVRGAVSDVDD